VQTWSRALREEHRIKALKRSEKEALMAGTKARGQAFSAR
jgi:predicted GIY-YIG superfamily endonuclease